MPRRLQVYISILSETRHQMEMNSKLYALATVPSKKQAAYHIEKGAV